MIEPGQFAHFGTFVFDLKQRMLTRNGGVVALAPKDVEILLMLIEGCGQVVERQEIIERVWPKTFVEEANLSRHIFTLRQILCEGGSRVIETIPKRGYRFVTPIRFQLAPTSGANPNVGRPAKPAEATAQVSMLRSASTTQRASIQAPQVKRRTHYTIAGLFLAVIVGVTGGILRARAPRRIMVAVLPVENLTGDPANEYICDGLTEELIVQAGQLSPRTLGVISRTSSMTYKTANKTAEQIGRELAVSYVIEGSLRESSGQFRVTEQMIHLPEEDHVWIREYDHTPTTDLIGMEDDVAKSVANLLAGLYSGTARTGSQISARSSNDSRPPIR